MSKKSVFEEIVNPQLKKIVPYLPGPMTKDIAAKYGCTKVAVYLLLYRAGGCKSIKRVSCTKASDS